jgi:subtilisin-like proprotein convertase family protein
MTIVAQSDTVKRELSVQLQIVAQAPPAPALYTPFDGRRGVVPQAALSWQAAEDALHYRVQISASPDFAAAHIVWEVLTADTVAAPQGLLPGTVYYWRVRAENACGQSAFTPFRAFQTAQATCAFAFDSQEVPVPISDGAPSTISSSLTLVETRPVADLDVQLSVRHSWVGDLRARLIGPDGTAVLLFDQPGVPELSPSGCSGEDADLLLDDEAAQTAEDLEKTCQSPPPALSGSFRPVEFLALFDNRPAFGSWRLELSDLQEEDGGALENWGLRCCLWDTLKAAALLRNETLVLPVGQMAPIDSSLLTADLQPNTPPEDGLFILLEPPQHGWLLYDGAPIGTGAVFSQADLRAGRVAYKHAGDDSTADAFFFDGLVVPTGQWLHHARFSIRIVQNDLVAALEILDSLRCHNGNDARLLASAQGGRPPYEYRLIGNADILQDDGLFENIGPGTYSVVVTDRWGFTAVSFPLIVPNPGPMVVNAISALDSVSVEVSGGTAPYRYRIGEGTYRSEPFFSGLPNGTYTVEVQDAFGCTASTEVIVYVGPLAVLAVQVTPPSCFDAADGSARIIAGGGVPPYRYRLNGEDFQTENTFLNLPSGEYTLTLLDKNDSTLTHTFYIEAPPPLQVSATVVLNRIEVAASGGTDPLHYRLDEGDYRPEPVFDGLANGAYIITVRDANGCTAQTTATVEVPPLRLLSVSVEGTIRCANETVLLSAEATGGVPPYRYALDERPLQANGIWEGVGAGPHVVVVRDAAGTQVSSDTFFIDAPPPLNVQVTTVGPHAYLTPDGGTPPYQYSLDGFTWTSDSSFFRLSNGAYSAVVRDTNGCTDTVYFNIFYFPLSALVRRTPPRCAGYSDGALEIDIVGGAPPFTCNGQILSDNQCSQTGLSAGTYHLVLADAIGDTLLLTVTLDDPPTLTVSAYAVRDTLVADATGGTGALSYSLDGLAFQASPVFAGLPNGIYTVTVRDANGCTAASAPVAIDIVGTSSLDASAAVRVYPNPTAGRLWVRLDRPTAQTLRLYLYGPQGALLRQYIYSVNAPEPLTVEMNLHTLPSGLYLLFGTDGRQTFRKSIIILPKD